MAWLEGYPREKVEWFPAINEDKCVSCGMCMNCGKNVYDWVDGKPKVARPYNCVVGCTSCANLCLGRAISFQDIESVRELYKKEGIWGKVKEELKKKDKIK